MSRSHVSTQQSPCWSLFNLWWASIRVKVHIVISDLASRSVSNGSLSQSSVDSVDQTRGLLSSEGGWG